eukprot:gene13726-19483_t
MPKKEKKEEKDKKKDKKDKKDKGEQGNDDKGGKDKKKDKKGKKVKKDGDGPSAEELEAEVRRIMFEEDWPDGNERGQDRAGHMGNQPQTFAMHARAGGRRGSARRRRVVIGSRRRRAPHRGPAASPLPA